MLLALLLVPLAVSAQQKLTSPEEFFGHQIGADYVLPDYTKFAQYWDRLARESDRMVLDTIGLTTEGRPQLMAIITSPENQAKLEHYREIAEKLARAEDLSEEQARALAREGKAVVWIDGGLHATEVLGAQQLLETSWQMVSGTDRETMRFMDDLIILLVHANPDGMELVSDWYMRKENPRERSSGDIPRLYQKYVGHDDNRDLYLSSQAESRNVNRVLYREWYPQIVYDHHQTGPAGTVMFSPPFRDPANYFFHPLIITGLDLIGSAMHQRFVEEDKPGVTSRTGSNYSTWWNGGFRTTPYFHNMIGLLTETIGNPTPMRVPLLASKQLPYSDLPLPIKPQEWHFRTSIDYSVTANRAVFDVASRYRERWLFGIWKMASEEVAAGKTDSWTTSPDDIARLEAAGEGSGSDDGAVGGRRRRGMPDSLFSLLRDSSRRDPRGYIIPAGQRDFLTATKFVRALQRNGIDVRRASKAFSVNGKEYGAGSYVVRTAQAFRPMVLDMFEPQDHPDDFAYPGGPPTPPYDISGWTLAMQMGVEYDRVLDDFEAPAEKLDTLATAPAGTVAHAPSGGGYLLSPLTNDAFHVVNRLLAAKDEVYRLTVPMSQGGRTYPAGTFFIRNGNGTTARVQALARELGTSFGAIGVKSLSIAEKLRPLRIGLWDRYGGSMPSGWTRWILEQYEFPYERVFPQTLDAGNLNEKFDVLIFVDGAIPERDNPRGNGFGGQPDANEIPEQYRSWLGSVTVSRTVPQLESFLRNGGTIVTIGSSTALARHLGLPVENQLVERMQDGTERGLSREKYYIPGALLQVHVDSTAPEALGMRSTATVFFDNSPVFRLGPDALQAGVRPVAWFDTDEPLRSGWAWGQGYLKGGVAIASAPVGKGRLELFGPEILFRAQPQGTFKFLFNSLYRVEGGE
jgi:hypothetical protein